MPQGLDEAATPEEREERLEKLREELPRRDRRELRIPSPGKAAKEAKKTRLPSSDVRECPRCHGRFPDLTAHRPECPKKFPKNQRWELAGPPATAPVSWETADSLAKEIEAAVETEEIPLVKEIPLVERARGVDSGEWSEEEIAAEVAPWPAAWASEEPKKKAERDGFDLAAWCLAVADLLWPGADHHDFMIGPKRNSHDHWWWAAVKRWDHAEASVSGAGPTRQDAVRALVDALRAKVGERQEQMAELVGLLEDR